MCKNEILAKLAANEIDVDAAAKLLAEQEKGGGRLTYKVSEKGAVSVYGLSAKWPTTLFLSQWERLIADLDNLKKFIEENRARCSTGKDDPRFKDKKAA